MFKYRENKGWKYQLLDRYIVYTGYKSKDGVKVKLPCGTINLSPSGKLYIPKMYAWDGATGGVDTENVRRASLVHDVFCQLINDGHLGEEAQLHADILLRKMCIKDGMSRFRAWWIYKAVRGYSKLKRQVVQDYTLAKKKGLR